MPLIASHSQKDARDAAWLLANTAKKCLEHPSEGPNWVDVLNNTYQLLDSYRSSEFFGMEAQPSRYARAMSGSEGSDNPAEHNISKVKDALDTSIDAVFSGKSRDQAIEELEDALRFVAYGISADENNTKRQHYQQITSTALSFFDRLSRELRTVQG